MPTYLRHKPTGDLYISTALLLQRTDMEEITSKQAAGVKSARTREARLALATEVAEEPEVETIAEEPVAEPAPAKKVKKTAVKPSKDK